MNRASSATGWIRDPIMKSPDLDPTQASSYELGWTFNPITGCLNHVNGLCKGGDFPCYAYRLANGRLRQKYLANRKIPIPNFYVDAQVAFADPFYPRFWKERLGELKAYQRWNTYSTDQKPRGIFVCDMGELFGNWIPIGWQEAIFGGIKSCPQHRFHLLTKQPRNLAKWSPFPENCWVGVTATDYWKYVDACNYLSQLEASVKFLSLEPLLSWDNKASYFFQSSGIEWLIIGAQTKPIVFPKIEWVQEILEAVDKAGIPVFLKDNLKPLLGNNLRQEIPDAK